MIGFAVRLNNICLLWRINKTTKAVFIIFPLDCLSSKGNTLFQCGAFGSEKDTNLSVGVLIFAF